MRVIGVCAILFIALGMALNITRAADAAPANVPDVECYPWADAEGWTITRCQDWSNGEVCLVASSGFVACTFD